MRYGLRLLNVAALLLLVILLTCQQMAVADMISAPGRGERHATLGKVGD
jgi:hypothetical protein